MFALDNSYLNDIDSQLNMDRKIMLTAMWALFLQREQLELFY
jgi:hypothetical protein